MKNYSDIIEWELEKRQIDSHGFIAYCQKFCERNEFKIARHHIFMAEKLEKAMTTPNYRLIIKMPPGHAKSTYASILAPTYFLGKFPKKNIIMTTHTQEFSDRWGRKCRSLILDPAYQYIFNTKLSKESSAASRFDLLNESSYYGCGILGNITGLRADLIIGDDWLRGIENADSDVMRQKIWDAWIWDLKTRLKPNGSVILVGTPWHEDDHFGRILESNDRDNWDVIELPALIETEEQKQNDALQREIGEPLWPEYITIKMLGDIKKSLNQKDMRMWNSLFQVKPTFEEGNYFQKEGIQRINHLPDVHLDYYGASDYAVTDGGGDYTVHGIVAYDSKHDEIYIVHIWRGRTTSNVWIEEFLDLAEEYETIIWAEENGQIIKSVGPFIEKRMQDRGHFVYRQQFTSATDKTARARAFQAFMAQKKVYILNDSWTDDFIKELLSFPSGRHDDQVDTLSLIGRLLRDFVKKVEKRAEKVQYEYEAGTLTLPGLDYKLNTESQPLYRKF